eukprot:5377958-Amphidinium_carterae.1
MCQKTGYALGRRAFAWSISSVFVAIVHTVPEDSLFWLLLELSISLEWLSLKDSSICYQLADRTCSAGAASRAPGKAGASTQEIFGKDEELCRWFSLEAVVAAIKSQWQQVDEDLLQRQPVTSY